MGLKVSPQLSCSQVKLISVVLFCPQVVANSFRASMWDISVSKCVFVKIKLIFDIYWYLIYTDIYKILFWNTVTLTYYYVLMTEMNNFKQLIKFGFNHIMKNATIWNMQLKGRVQNFTWINWGLCFSFVLLGHGKVLDLTWTRKTCLRTMKPVCF